MFEYKAEMSNGRLVVALRGPLNNINGYIVSMPGDPLYGIGYDVADGIVSIHGGFTYADSFENFSKCLEPGVVDSIAHLAYRESGGSMDVSKCWVLGFDTLHLGDCIPQWAVDELEPEERAHIEFMNALTAGSSMFPTRVWDVEDVMDELKFASTVS